ncbi:peroxisome assembly protein (Peroxin-2) [Exophiala dermatitidis]|uniref:Peroxisomal biogenesis factor 2 n=2 Tax=Exophiala dermatitidis TaxID=5970 RepID=H6C1U8_EXODN|nr:peroxisomal biogenesis factor 2 [Exophiala dermatitidis NIH/UT8656]KAJ4508424.1 peroxisome assembly protein (Peroxin-2) [Exophiala dermatitidis]EHY58634.1 peroxisomal biogenesis factor 2 [Exophiala dermatitidis NIH/UT8656]KAJ4510331.1 peroxisome assembly protein (Peroxin-2) [Exophiala dermatitidis]KAJ4510734.1 peroxisome assembly protein (Peroxin-2) [Exophiala dermatitidis]KAJ4534939.1 peroxisome assembly protein (Peroxin-2) [Exophiala dermatitidis]
MSASSFAAAQERILAQQVARQQEARARQQQTEISGAHTSLSRIAHSLRPGVSSLWSTLLESEGTRPAFRVGQVDAELLDEELLGLLKTQVGDALKYLGPHLQDDWSQEILLALRAALFKLSIWDNDASYGASLQNLRYTDARQSSLALPKPTKWQKGLYGLITIFGRYGWDKWQDWLIDQERGYTAPSEKVQRLMRATSFISTTHSIAAFCSFLVFLVNGRYRTLTDRLLRLRLVSPSNQVSREVSFEYLNRQLVWHAFTEFLLFLLPLVGINRWRKWLSRAWKRTKDAMRSESAGDDDEKIKSGPLSFLPERTCAICYNDQNPTSTSEAEILGANVGAGGGVIGSATTDIVNPYETIACRCIYCFVCIAKKIEAEEGGGWSCLRCGELVYKCRPWNGDVLEERKFSGKNGKTVGFSFTAGDEAEGTTNENPRDGARLGESTLSSSEWSMTGADSTSG